MMTFINVDLRLNNLTAAFNATLDDLLNSFNLSDTKAVASNSKEYAETINNSEDYYTKAPKRGSESVSIERELKAQGNAW